MVPRSHGPLRVWGAVMLLNWFGCAAPTPPIAQSECAKEEKCGESSSQTAAQCVTAIESCQSNLRSAASACQTASTAWDSYAACMAPLTCAERVQAILAPTPVQFPDEMQPGGRSHCYAELESFSQSLGSAQAAGCPRCLLWSADGGWE